MNFEKLFTESSKKRNFSQNFFLYFEMIGTVCHDSRFNNEFNPAVSRRKSKNLIKALKMNEKIKSQVFSIFISARRLFKNVFCFFCSN